MERFLLPAKLCPSRGILIYLMGASGSGKDTLLQAIDRAQQADDTLVIARRHITRKPRANCEGHISVGETEFEARERAGDFLFSWQAHGFYYGIDRNVLTTLSNGQHVLMNGSRHYLMTAQDIYPELIPVYLEVAPEVLEPRLHARGRETPNKLLTAYDVRVII